LDILSRPITVQCFKKGPSDSDFTQFGDNINLTNGGNGSHCSLSSVLIIEGFYQFKVIATADTDSTEIIVPLDYKTSGPGTPNSYSKEKINNCDYKINFKSADDNDKTIKVEIYRSDKTSFNTNSGTLVSSIAIGSNQESITTNSVPNCSQDYYYAIRAFDSAGNGSGVIGDSIITKIIPIITTNPTPTSKSAIPVKNITLAPEPTISAEEGRVLGTETTSPTFFQKYKLPLIFIVVILFPIIGYVLIKKSRAKTNHH
jgi:hypothetical protein